MTGPMGDEERLAEEAGAVRARYARRVGTDRYSMLKPDVWQSTQERQRAMIRLLVEIGCADLGTLRILEVGCGSGNNLLDFLRFGAVPENLVGVDLLPDRVAAAASRLPGGTRVLHADAARDPIVPEASQDIVLAATVFSSILDPLVRERLAARIWSWVRPGGGILWYDFTYDNPANRDVVGIPAREVTALFPEGRIICRRLTLAPPLSRRICGLHPSAYHILNAIPWLRSHILCWIGKAGENFGARQRER